MLPFKISNGSFVYIPSLLFWWLSLEKTFQSYSENEPAVIGHRTTEGKLLRNLQDGVTMETRPCGVLLRSSPLQSPWWHWQRTEYSNLPGCLPWQLRQGHFGDSLGGLWGLPSEASSKSLLGGMLCANPAKQLIMKRSVKWSCAKGKEGAGHYYNWVER